MDNWSLIPTLGPSARAFHAAAQGSILLFGGQGGSTAPLSDTWKFDETTNTWSQGADLPIPLTKAQAATIPPSQPNDVVRVLVFGGTTTGGTLNGRTFYYFPDEQSPPPITEITVAIDIKPGSFPNSINPRSKGVIPVAILTTATFEATTVNPTTVLFGPTGTEAAPVRSALEDVDGDGDTDMVLHFNTQATGIQCGDTSASLTGATFSGQEIEGSDSIKTAGCK